VKPSGGEWLGDIPDDWKVVQLRHLATIETGSKDTVMAEVDGKYPFIVRSPEPLAINSWTFDTEAILTAGDGNVGEVFHHVEGKFEAHQRVYVIHRFRGINGRYLYWYFMSQFRRVVAYGGNETTVASLRRPMFTSFRVALPSTESAQRAIADFLDRETAQIDAFIAKSEQLIALLTERRAAAVHTVVTSGLDASASLKASGSGWMGDVPAHWEVGNIRRFATMKSGHTPSRTVADYWIDCNIPWFTLSDVWQLRQGNQYLGETKESISALGLEHSAAELLPAGTVVLSRTASVGFAGVVPAPMATSQDYWNWIPSPALDSEYLWWQFQSMSQEFARLKMGSTHATIYQGDAAALTIVVPPLSEQRAIVEHLDSTTGKIDAAIAAARRSIDLARERRATLISAAVTGQLDLVA
jgi:type I restriction enzyme S subunit